MNPEALTNEEPRAKLFTTPTLTGSSFRGRQITTARGQRDREREKERETYTHTQNI